MLFIPFSVSVGGEQAFRCREQSPFAVRFDGAAFENEVQPIDIFTVEQLVFIDTAGNQIVEIGGEFQTPTVECEIENPGLAGFRLYEGDAAVVACPSIVGLTLEILDVFPADFCFDMAADKVYVGCDDQ